MAFPGFLGFYLDGPFGAILFSLFFAMRRLNLFELLRRAEPREDLATLNTNRRLGGTSSGRATALERRMRVVHLLQETPSISRAVRNW